MRGKDSLGKPLLSRVGITPAYAGKRTAVCKFLAAVPGSPPPMRGKAIDELQNMVDKRITPAYAGKRYETFPYVTCC